MGALGCWQFVTLHIRLGAVLELINVATKNNHKSQIS